MGREGRSNRREALVSSGRHHENRRNRKHDIDEGVRGMYLVIKKSMMGSQVETFESLTDAQEAIQRLAERGCFSAILAQQIPTKVRVEVEF